MNLDTAERPFVLIWEVTQACDLACKHCRAEAQPERHPMELSTGEGKQLLDHIRQFGEGQLLVLSGGDPLYREDTINLIEYGIDQGLQMTLTPSGTSSLTPARIEELAGTGLRRLALSLDGASPAAHDSFRKEEGSFDQTVAAAQAAREVGLPLQINTTVCAETLDELPAIRQLVADLDCVLWSVFFLVPVGRGSVLEPVTPERGERIMEWLVRVEDEESYGIKTTEAPQYRRVKLQRQTGPERTDAPTPDGIGRRTGITAGDGFAFISHTGEVYPSGFLPLSAGNVRETNIVDIYRDAPLFQALREPNRLKGKCGACEFQAVCGGSRSRAFAYTGDVHESDPLCPYIPETFDGAIPQQTFEVAPE